MRPVRNTLGILCLIYALPVSGQQPVTPSIQQAAITAFSPNAKLPASVKLSGTADWSAGSQKESGSLQLQVAADGSASEAWSFSTVSHSYVQSALNADRACKFTDARAKSHDVSLAQCSQAVPWFSPWFALQAIAAGTLVPVADPVTLSAAQGETMATYSIPPPAGLEASKRGQDGFLRLQKASAVTVFYDSQTALPTRLAYRQPFDDDDSRGVEILIRFSDYQAESGFMIPHHIERYVQQSLLLDFHVTTVIAE